MKLILYLVRIARIGWHGFDFVQDVLRSLFAVTSGTEELKVSKSKLSAVKRNARRTCHSVMTMTGRHYAVELKILIRPTGPADSTE